MRIWSQDQPNQFRVQTRMSVVSSTWKGQSGSHSLTSFLWLQQFHSLSPQIHNHNTTTFPTSNPTNSSFHFLTSFPQIPTSYYCSQTQLLRFQILFFFLPLHSYNSNNKLFFSQRPISNRRFLSNEELKKLKLLEDFRYYWNWNLGHCGFE